jgi:hypothetical protein
MTQNQLVVEIPDPHFPSQDDHAVNAVLNFIADKHPKQIVLLGDVLDFAFIGSFAQDAIKQLFTNHECWKTQWKAGNKFLDDLQAAGPLSKITYIQGNHEYRPERILQKDPTREGSVEIPEHLGLAERGIRYVRFWETGEVYKIGKMSYGHGWYTCENHAKKTLNDYGCNFTNGHDHTVQVYTKAFKSTSGAIQARSVGCLCKKDMPYMRGRPSAWIQGFGITEFYDNGLFSSYEPVIINGKCSFDGHRYSA